MSTHDGSIAYSAPYDGRVIANYILDLADEKRLDLTQMQLLKIVYFAHGWYLSSEGKPLIKQQFEAWKYGPVVRVIRDAFKDFGIRKITSRAEKLDIYTGELQPLPKLENNYDLVFIKAVFDSYCTYDGWQLSDLTHEVGSPWDKIWNSNIPVGRLALRIDENEIRKHFESIPNRFVLN